MEQRVLAADGWDGVNNMVNSIRAPLAGLGVSVLVLVLIYVAIKSATKGKGNIREAFSELGMVGFACVVLGLAATLPYVLQSVGSAIGNSSNGGSAPVSVVQGQ